MFYNGSKTIKVKNNNGQEPMHMLGRWIQVHFIGHVMPH